MKPDSHNKVDASIHAQVIQLNQELNEDGLRVIAVAYKELPPDQGTYSVTDEHNLILMGPIAFLDPPKDSAASAIAAVGTGNFVVKVILWDLWEMASTMQGSSKVAKPLGISFENCYSNFLIQ